LIGWIADTQSNGRHRRRHRQDNLFADRSGASLQAPDGEGDQKLDYIYKIDNNSQYYSFVKTTLVRSLNARAIAGILRFHR
jgi:hypothetical protein